jgi:hypothetical protein
VNLARQKRVRITARGAAVDSPGNSPVAVGLLVATRSGQRPQRPRRARQPADTGAGRRQHKATHPARCLVRELLCDDAAERHPEDVDDVEPERIEQPLGGSGHAAHPAWPGVGRRFADAGSVVAVSAAAQPTRPMLQRVTSATVDPVVRGLSRSLMPRVDEFAQRMADRIRAQEPLYAEGQAVAPEDLRQSCRDNLLYVFGRLAGELDLGTEAPRATGIRRAEAGVPLSSLLQAFRIGGRLIWELLVENADTAQQDTLLRCAADIWAVSDELAEAASDAYRGASADRAQHDNQLRSALLNSLLDGKLGDAARLWESAGLLKLPQRGTFVVVAAECPSPGEEPLPRVEELLRRHDVVSAWRLDAELQEGLVSLRPRFDVGRLCQELGRIALRRVGVSETYGNLEQTTPALRQARLACTAGTPHTTDLVRYEQQPVSALLVSAPDVAESAARRILGPVLDLPDQDRAVITATARVWLASSGSTSTAATRLHLHRNTVRYRLRRLEELTGRSLANPLDLAELHVALECARILNLA